MGERIRMQRLNMIKYAANVEQVNRLKAEGYMEAPLSPIKKESKKPGSKQDRKPAEEPKKDEGND